MEAKGRDEALASLKAVAAADKDRQERFHQAMEACQHLQSELETSQVPTCLPAHTSFHVMDTTRPAGAIQ